MMASILYISLSLLIASCALASKPPSYHTFVHLFEWKWLDIAKECEDHLAPAGYKAVQISPPQEHIQGPQWWTRYQPVSYKLQSRGGSRAQLKEMIDRCGRVGIDIYADAVINHMAGSGSGVGTAGSSYKEFYYPGVPFGDLDFNKNCLTSNGEIQDYNNINQVRNCQLVGLDDLALGKEYVRGKIAGYLNDLLNLGVKGFRFDAAKHMWPGDLQAIVARLPPNTYIFTEVIASGTEPIQPPEYYELGDVTDFAFGRALSANVLPEGKFHYLQTLSEQWDGFVSNNKAVVFVENHDNERGHGGGGNILNYSNGQFYEVAVVFMLSWPFGYPKVMSSYSFPHTGSTLDTDQGPPGSSPHTACGFNEPWICQHRWRPIESMVRFRLIAGNAPVTRMQKINNNAIAFGRGDKGFVVINRGSGPITASLITDLPDGRYCDVARYQFKDDTCSGPYTDVSGGRLSVQLAALSASVFHVDAKKFTMIDGKNNGTTCGSSQSTFVNMHLRGTFNNWGALPMNLSADSLWTATNIKFTGNKRLLKFDVNGDWAANYGDDNGDGLVEMPGDDIPVPCESSFTVAFNDNSKAYFLYGNCNGPFQSNYNQMHLRGTFNDWAARPMTLSANNVWTASNVKFSGTELKLKFDISGDWKENYGDNQDDGIAEKSGDDIKVPCEGTFTVAFNDRTKAYFLVPSLK